MFKHWFETIKIIFRCTVCCSLVYAIANAVQAGVSLANFLAKCLGRLCAQGIIQIQTNFKLNGIGFIATTCIWYLEIRFIVAMNSIPFDWSKLIAKTTDESFGIMPDVTFQIVEKMGTKRKLHEVKAHKMILEMVSPTFKTMFYITDVGDKALEMIQISEVLSLTSVI